MLDVTFDYDGYKFSSVKECDISRLSEWMKNNNDEDNFSIVDEQILYRRFLECYITDDEFFIKILKKNKIHGIIKGNITREKRMELFLWLFVLDKKDRHKGKGKKIIEIFLKHICNKYSLVKVNVGVCSGNKGALNFWKCLGFEVYRTSEKFFRTSDEVVESLVLMNNEKILL